MKSTILKLSKLVCVLSMMTTLITGNHIYAEEIKTTDTSSGEEVQIDTTPIPELKEVEVEQNQPESNQDIVIADPSADPVIEVTNEPEVIVTEEPLATAEPIASENQIGPRITNEVVQTGKIILSGEWSKVYFNSWFYSYNGNTFDNPNVKGAYLMYPIKDNKIIDFEKTKVYFNGVLAADQTDFRASSYPSNETYSYIYITSNGDKTLKDVEIRIEFVLKEIDHNYDRDFTVRVRNNLIQSDETLADSYLKEEVATYRLEKLDGTLSFYGVSKTFNSWDNFVYWTLEKGEGSYFSRGTNYLHNLPDGEYKVTRLFAGKNIIPAFTSSSTPYFNASNLQYTNSADPFTVQTYTFTINDELVNELMADHYNNQQANSVFFGFYGKTLDPNAKVHLYFDGNGHAGGSMRNLVNQSQDSTVTLPENQFIRYNYDFMGWNTVANPTESNPGVFYADQAEFTFKNNSVTLYAQWKEKTQFYHRVLICDFVTDKAGYDGSTVVLDTFDLAFTQEVLNQRAQAYITKKGYGETADHVKTEIRVKNGSSKDPWEWDLYTPGMEFTNKETINYIIYIDKAENYVDVTFDRGAHGQLLDQDGSGQVHYKIEKGTSLSDNGIVAPQITADSGYKVANTAWSNNYSTSVQLEEDVIYTAQYNAIEGPAPIIPVVPPVEPTEEEPEIIVVPPVITPIINPQLPQEEEIIEEEETPEVIVTPTPTPVEEEFVDEATPEAGGSWALINLIASILTVITMMITILGKLKKEEEDEETNEENKFSRRRWTKVASVLVSVISVVLFILTENMRLPMTMIDRYTIWMIILFIANVVVFVIGRFWKKEEDEEETAIQQ